MANKSQDTLTKQEKEMTARQERVQRLREQAAEASDARATREREASNDIFLAQLDREEAQLQVRLEEERRTSSTKVIKDASLPVLESVKDQMELAVKQREGIGASDEELRAHNEEATAQSAANAKAATEEAQRLAEANADVSAGRPAATGKE